MSRNDDILKNAREMRMKGFNGARVSTDMKLDSIVQGLERITEDLSQHYPRVSESMFVRQYLLAFAGRGVSKAENYAIYLEWLEQIAGNYNMPVHVCEDTDQSKILFTVPAVSNVKVIDPAKIQTRDVMQAVTMATEARHVSPHGWEGMLRENLYKVLKSMYNKGNVLTPEQKVWASIFQRYESILKDKPLLQDEGDDANAKTNQAGSTQTPAITYTEVDDPV